MRRGIGISEPIIVRIEGRDGAIQTDGTVTRRRVDSMQRANPATSIDPGAI